MTILQFTFWLPSRSEALPFHYFAGLQPARSHLSFSAPA